MNAILEHPMNKDIDFKKEGDANVYTYLPDGSIFQGVTGWIKRYQNFFDVNAAAMGTAIKTKTSVKQVLAMWEDEKQTSLEYGVPVHNNIDNYFSKKEYDLKYTKEILSTENLLKERGINVVSTEFTLADPEIKRASSIDILGEKDGKLVVVDIKTTKSTSARPKNKRSPYMLYPLHHLYDSDYYKFCLQVNIYAFWLKNVYKMPVDDTHYILHIRPNQYKMIPVIDLTHEVELIRNREIEYIKKGLFSEYEK